MASLLSRVNTFTRSYHDGGIAGLILMNDLAKHIAFGRDWSDAATLLEKTDENVHGPFKLILRAYFGDKLKLKKDATHKSGWRFTMDWKEGEEPLPTNHYGLVRKAIDEKTSYFSKAFLKELRKDMEDPDKGAKAIDIKAQAKRLLKQYEDNDTNIGLLIVALESLRKEQKALVVEKDKKVVNI